MSEQGIILDQSLRKLYYDPLSGYQSQAQLYQDAKEEGLNVSRAKIKEWFEHQSTYTRFKQPIKRFRRRQTYVSSMGKQLQMDMVDMSKFDGENDGYRWILTAIDVFSKYAFATPVRRKHKEFMEPAVTRVLEEYEKKFGKYPDVVQFDNGGEFYNQRVLPFLKSLDIRYFSTRLTSKKASIAERLNRSLKTIMWKFFDGSGENKWIDVLDLFVENVDSRKNRSIGMSPDQVSKDNSYEEFAKLYGHAISMREPKFNEGDIVRISEYASPFYDTNKKKFKKG